MRNLQEIYDFCLSDRTYNAYYDIPDDFSCKTERQYRYYHASVCRRGVTRAGTFIYGQAQKQLRRYLGIEDRGDYCIRFFIHASTLEITDRDEFNPLNTIFISTDITSKGVKIRFSHPFGRADHVYYLARSHNRYSEEGIRRDVVNYINRHILYPKGRYRDLQMEFRIKKEDFVSWYKNYKKKLEIHYETEYWEMYHKYKPEKYESISFEESYSILEMCGAFYDFGADDEFERENMAEEYMRLCNRK